MKRTRNVGVALLAVLIFTSSTVFAEPSSADNSPAADESSSPSNGSAEKKSMKDLLIDPEDGMVDASAFLGTASGFLPVGGLITEPAVGYGGSMGLMFLHDSIKNRAQRIRELTPDGKIPRLEPPSISGIGGFGTSNGSWGSGLLHFGVWKKDHIRYLGALVYSSVNLDLYGLGNFSLSYNLEGVYLLQQAIFRIFESDFFLGAKYQFMKSDVDFKTIKRTTRPAGLGVIAEYDSRNTIFTPDSGINARMEVLFFDEALGGDSEFRKFSNYIHGWIPLHPSWVLGLRLAADFSTEATPFFLEPFVDLRGIPGMRYQGQHSITSEAELRWDVTQRWSLLGFFGAGWTAKNKIKDFSDSDTQIAGGGGFRYLIARVFNIRTGMDFGWSEEDFAFYFTTGTAW